jgi:hypothetical protein
MPAANAEIPTAAQARAASNRGLMTSLRSHRRAGDLSGRPAARRPTQITRLVMPCRGQLSYYDPTVTSAPATAGYVIQLAQPRRGWRYM